MEQDDEILPRDILATLSLEGVAHSGHITVTKRMNLSFVGCDSSGGLGTSLLGGRLVKWPSSAQNRSIYSLVSSRLGRKLGEQQAWFRMLRAIVANVADNNGVLLSVPGTTCHRFVVRAASLFGVDCICLTLPPSDSIKDWWETHVGKSDCQSTDAADRNVAFLSPVFKHRDEESTEFPLRDRAVVTLADQVIALKVRSKGNVDALMRKRAALASSEDSDSGTRVVLDPELTKPKLTEELLDAGVVGWIPLGLCRETKSANPVLHRPAAAFRMPEDCEAGFLTHCTRRARGAWPNQTEQQYTDELILDSGEVDHSPFAAVRRIVTSGRLIASPDSIRGKSRVVCFTEVALAELKQLRVFRSHRGRWDFEPYGVCVRRSALEEVGASPVIYGDEEDWASLTEMEKPLFQKEQSTTPSGDIIDWTVEQEWRHVGDVMLSQFEVADVFVFVPTATEARKLSAVSPWRVVVV